MFVRSLCLLLAAPPAGALYITGILETNSYQLGVDSVIWRFQQPPMPIVQPTPGWGGDSLLSDTFQFNAWPRWPNSVRLFCAIRGGGQFEDTISPVVRDSWYELEVGPLLTNPRVRFEETTYVAIAEPGTPASAGAAGTSQNPARAAASRALFILLPLLENQLFSTLQSAGSAAAVDYEQRGLVADAGGHVFGHFFPVGRLIHNPDHRVAPDFLERGPAGH